MKSNDSAKKHREKSKTRAWEKERRDRLSECFTKLRVVLPNYDASKKLSKIEVLVDAAATIKDLDEKLKNLLVPPEENAKSEERRLKISAEIIKKLQDRIKKLLVRNEELVNLLKNAGINVPSAFGAVKKFRKSYKFSNKITHSEAKILQNELEKENQVKPPKPPKPKKTKRNTDVKYKKVSSNSKSNKSLKRQLTNLVSSPNCLFIVSQPRIINNSCYIVSKNPRKINQTVISNPLLVKTPIVSSNIKPSILSTNPPLSDLRAGTLVFANGTVMPVVPTPPPLPILPTILTNPVQTNLPTFIVVSSNAKTSCVNKICVSTGTKSTAKSSAGNLDPISIISNTPFKDPARSSVIRPVLKPKTCITRTTQINKVPIPALSSKYNGHSCLKSLKVQGADKKDQVSTFMNEIKKSTENVSNNKFVKKRISEEPQKEVKKSKSSVEENKKNLEETVLTTDAQHNDRPVDSKVEVSVLSNEPRRSVPSVIDEEKVVEQQEPNKDDQKCNESIKILSVFNLDQHTSTSVTKLDKNPAITVKPLEDLICTSNKGSHSPDLDSASLENNSKKISQPKDVDSHTTQEYQVSSVAGNGNNNVEIIKESVQRNMCNKPRKNSEPLISTELVTSINTSATSTCNKQESKTFEINISQAESVSKNTNDLKSLEINLPQSELSNDIFASFQVPSGCQNPGSTSPTAAFLLAFPLVSSGTKVTEVIGDENSDSHAGTPNLLQIGTMEIAKPTQSYSESLTPNILNFENFSFFSNKDNCGGFYNNCSLVTTTCQTGTISAASSSKASSTFTDSTAVPSRSIVDNGNQNNHSKLNATDNLKFMSTNKAENTIKSSNNYNTDIGEKVSTNIKSSNVNIHHDPLQMSKDLKAQSYISTAYSFDRSNELGNKTTNILNMNTNCFSSKTVSKENYANQSKSNMVPQVFVSKSPDSCTNYPNYSYCTSFITNSVAANKNYNPVYTNAANNNYFYNSSGSGGDTRNFNSSSCINYSDYRKLDNYNTYNESSHVYNKEKCNQNVQPKIKSSSSQSKPINWMTSPSTTVSYKPEYFLPSFSKENNFNPNLNTNAPFNTLPSNTYFNTSSVYNSTDHLNNTADFRKTSDLSLPTYSSYQRTDSEENQFSWSPNKLPQFLDSTHSHTFVSSTLPTLVGDLALNNTPNLEQKNIKDKSRDNRKRIGNCENQSSQTNFLSVSQLVEHSQEHIPAKVISRRSSGNRSKTNTPKAKRVVNRSDANKDLPNYQKNDKVNQQKHYDNISVATNLFSETKQPRNNKNIPSSYSAEALIGNQLSADSSSKRNVSNHNKSIVPNFLSDNVVSYFPAVDVPQDNSYMQTTQSFQANSFSQNFTTTFQNNGYGANNFIPSACTITSTYIPNNNFMHSSNTQEFLGENPNIFQNTSSVQTKDKNNYMKNYYRQPDKNEKSQAYNCKKAKKRSTNESALPSFDIPFLSMPGAINSPILPDDFHTTYLAPTTLYSCKNPLYSKPNSEITPSTLIPPLPAISGNKSGTQHSEMSPLVNSVGTSLTNFNLSTIFPEINKGPIQDTFSDTRNKDYQPVSKSFSMSSSLQVPFSSKSSIPFGSFGT